MDSSVYQCNGRKTKVRNEVLFHVLLHSSNNSKAIARGKNTTKSTKDLSGHSNHVVGSNMYLHIAQHITIKLIVTVGPCLTRGMLNEEKADS